MALGYFGVSTSSINWCETDYSISYYIAEFYNTLSNIPPIIFISIALYYGSIRIKKDLKDDIKVKDVIEDIYNNEDISYTTIQPTIILYSYLIPIIVFIGSFIFHSTLTYAGQLLDELPMIYGICYFNWILSSHLKKLYYTIFWTSVAIIITLTMILFRDSPLPLQLSYGLLVAVLIVRCSIIYNTIPQLRTNLLKNCVKYYGAGTICWLIDLHLCSFHPWIEFFYLHAWWHILVGIGTYYVIQFLCIYNLYYSNSQTYRFGRLLNVLPFIVASDLKPGHITNSILIQINYEK